MGVRFDVIDCDGRYCANSIGIGFEALVTYHSLSITKLRGTAALTSSPCSKHCVRRRASVYRIDVDGREAAAGDFPPDLGGKRSARRRRLLSQSVSITKRRDDRRVRGARHVACETL
jgi:hypothetical protein